MSGAIRRTGLVALAVSAAALIVVSPAWARDQSPAVALTASFTFSPSSPTVGKPVRFDGSASTCPHGPCTFSWSDDGGTTQPKSPIWPLGTGDPLVFTFRGPGTKYLRLTLTDSLGQTATVEHDVTIASASPPVNTVVPVITGTPQQGQILTANQGTWSGAAPISYRYLWSDGATGSTDLLSAADVGQTVSVTVTAANAAGTASATSAAVGPVSTPPPPPASPPVNTVVPMITGTPQQGQTLTTDNGSWTGSPTSFAYRWQDCNSSGAGCTNISGASSSTYRLDSTDVSDTIRAVVTATNGGGSTSATSAQTSAVGAASSGSGCTSTLTPSTFTASAVKSASGGSVLCLSAGTYTALTISGANPGSYVTIQPSPGANVTIQGLTTLDSASYLRFQGLTVTGTGPGTHTGFNITGSPSHDFQFINDDIGNGTYGIAIDGANGTSNVLVQGDKIHNLDFTGSSAGYAGGQGVTCYYCLTGITVSRSKFWAVSWHYIQCGGCDDFTVDHNLFTCPCNQHSGAHLNVFQIWQGGSDDSFTNNIVLGDAGTDGGSGEICGGCVLFENGPGGGTASDQFTNYNISNNLFLNSGGSLPIQVQTTTGGTVSNNTVADGFTYGIAIGYNAVTGVQSTNLNSQYNIVAGQTGNGQAYRYGAASGVSDHNVADSHGGTSGTGSTNGWTENWITTTWNDPIDTPMPAGYYRPADLGSSYGYQGRIGP